MAKKELEMEKLGNFGFLLKYKQDLLFELAKLAESNVYVNTRLSGIYIRQLSESFLNVVAENAGIMNEEDFSDLGHYIYNLPRYANERRISDITHCMKIREMFRKDYSSTEYTAVIPSEYVKYLVQYIQNTANPDYKKINELQNTGRIDRWEFIRRLGNACSHSGLLEKNTCWIKPIHMIEGLKILQNIMINYYSISNHNNISYDDNAIPFASGQVYFNCDASVEYPGNDVLAGYTESLCCNTMPTTINNNPVFKINKFAIIRKFPAIESMKNFLQHSQEAYLILQKKINIDGLANYSVLADYGIDNQYYITAYEFNNKPLDIDINNLDRLKVYDSIDSLKKFFLQIANTLMKMDTVQVYHRNLTHKSIKICRVGNYNFKTYIIDLELVKLVDGYTVYAQAEEAKKENLVKYYGNLKQYIDDERNNGNSYEIEVIRRFGCIGANVLCPIHLENKKTFEKSATLEEVLSEKNILVKKVFKNNELLSMATLFEELQLGKVVSWPEVIRRLQE